MPTYAFGDYELDTSLYQLRQSSEIIEIGPRVFDLLVYLILRRDHLVTKDELIREVWGASAMSGSSVPTCIAAVRKAIGDDPANPRYIETHRGRGYRFIAAISETPDESSSHSKSSPPGHSVAKRGANHPIFVGRDTELTALYAAFERSLTGTPQLVLISGEAGIGKTRILEELALSVRDDGAVVLLGRCVEGGGAPAFWPWVQIIRTYIEATDADAISKALGPLVPSLFHMIPELTDLLPDVPPPPPDDSEQARFRLFDAVTALLRKAAAERPLLLLMDDLHRADTASLSLLQFAIHELREAQILFIGTYRDGDPQLDSTRAQLLAHLTREEPTRCIELRGLDYGGVEKFVEEASDSGTADANLVSALHEQTGGNPFFLTQIVHLLVADGRLEMPATPKNARPFELPGGVREAITRQLEGLPNDTRELLEVAAIIGREFSLDLVGSVVEKHPLVSLQPALESRLIAPLVSDVGRFFFTHMILRDCIYEALSPEKRAHLHHQIAQVMDELSPARPHSNSSELAHHYLEATLIAGSDAAIVHSIQAGDWATARLAYEDAPAHYRQAIHLIGHGQPNRSYSELLLMLGEAELRAGERDRSRETLKQAASIARFIVAPDLIARAALAMAPGFFAIEVGAHDRALVDLLEEALESLGKEDSPLRAQVLARLAIALVWSTTERRRSHLSIEALEMARRLKHPASLVAALTARHESLWGKNQFRDRSAITREIASAASRINDSETYLLHHLLQTTANLEAGLLFSADQEIIQFSEIAKQTRQPQYLWYVDLFLGMRSLMKGDFQRAELLAHRFLAIGEQAKDINATQSFGTHLSILRWEQGRAREVLPVVEDFIVSHPSVSAWKCVRLFLQHDIGNTDRAAREFNFFAQDNFESLSDNTNRIVSLCLLAEICCALNDRRNAKILYELLLPDRSLNAVIGFSTAFFGSVEDRLGMLSLALGQTDDANNHFLRAISAHENLDSPPWIARSQFNRASMLLSRNSQRAKNEARRLAHASRTIATRIGMRNLIQKLDKAFAANSS